MTVLDPPEGAESDYEDDDFDDDLAAGSPPVARTQWQLFRSRFFRHKGAMFGLFVLVALCFCCFGATWVAPFPKGKLDLLATDNQPSWKHLFGLDPLGRDYFSEVLYAGQVSLTIGLGVGVLSTIIGSIIGAVAGYYGRWRDAALMRITDLFLIVPQIAVLAIALKKFGYSTNTIVLVLTGLFWMTIARIVRGQVLSLNEKEFVEAARAAGASDFRIIFRTILPNLVGPISVNATLSVALAIATESTLSFLGFGIQRPNTSWGNMLSDARSYIGTNQAYLVYFPGLMLLLITLAINFLGDGLRDALDPQGDDR
jgi:peptide/nickel transport system permease protein